MGWITSRTPEGINSTVDEFRAILTATENGREALLAFDREVRGNSGPPLGNQNAAKDRAETTLDNIQGCLDETKPPKAPTGTSAQAGLRRLDKAAADGDEAAKEALDKVKAGKLSVHKACIMLNFRKGPPTPIELLKREWRKASVDEREAFRTWIDSSAL